MSVFKIIANKIKNIFSENPRIKLLKLMPKDSICAEIGVWRGDYSKKILDIVKPKELHLIDPWHFFSDEKYKDSIYGGKEAKSEKDMENIYNDVLKRFSQNKEVIIKRNTFELILNDYPDEYFDWVYIDGDHSYEAVKKDLYNSEKKVKKGGFITGDDYREGGWWKGGVKRAVNEFIKEYPDKRIKIVGDQYVIKN